MRRGCGRRFSRTPRPFRRRWRRCRLPRDAARLRRDRRSAPPRDPGRRAVAGEAADDLAGLRGAAGLAPALAAERALGDAALAAVRRGAPVLAAAFEPRRGLALAARRHAQPGRAGARARLAARGPGARARRAVAREALRPLAPGAAAVARAARADP